MLVGRPAVNLSNVCEFSFIVDLILLVVVLLNLAGVARQRYQSAMSSEKYRFCRLYPSYISENGGHKLVQMRALPLCSQSRSSYVELRLVLSTNSQSLHKFHFGSLPL